MKLRYLFGILLVFAAISPLLAQSDAPATREDVLKLFNTMQIHEQMRLVMDTVAKQQRAMIHEAIRRRSPQITDQELAKLDQLTSDVMKDMPVDSLLEDMIPVYQKHLSRSDVDAMNIFYASPTGQKLCARCPQ